MTRKGRFKIHSAGPKDKQAWDTYVLSHPHGLAYHLFAWKEAIEKAYGFDCPYFVAKKDAKICGLLPTAHIHWPLRPGTLVSLPYCDVGGILADSQEIAEALLDHVLSYARECSIPCIELRFPGVSELGDGELQNWLKQKNPIHQSTNKLINYSTNISNQPIDQSTNISNQPINQSTNQPINQSPNKVRMLLSLPHSSEALLYSFKSKLRSQVKKASRDGLYSEMGGLELVDDFYSIFCENMRDLGSPVHSKKWIRNILEAYGSRARCGLVYMSDGTPAACGIILMHNQTVSIPWASSLRRFNSSNPNMLLYWTFLEYAADNSYAFFDFGRSTPGEGTYKFKEQWGAKPQPLPWVRIDTGSGNVESIKARNDKQNRYRARPMMERILQCLPIPVATFVGSRLRKYITL